MSDRHTVIGHFDCGCGQAAQPESLEVVICNSGQEVDEVVERMKQHSAGHQCWQEPAMAIIVVPGEPRVAHEVEQLPEAYLLFPDLNAYVQSHEQRKKADAAYGRTTLAIGLERMKREQEDG